MDKMRQFLSSFFLSWTATLTVTAFYLSSKLLEPSRIVDGMEFASAVGFGVLFIGAMFDIIHKRWIRPEGYVLISTQELEFLTWCHDELAEKNNTSEEYS